MADTSLYDDSACLSCGHSSCPCECCEEDRNDTETDDETTGDSVRENHFGWECPHCGHELHHRCLTSEGGTMIAPKPSPTPGKPGGNEPWPDKPIRPHPVPPPPTFPKPSK